jgi:large subunit ribosomal protein L6
MSGVNSTGVQYLENNKNIPLHVTLTSKELILQKSNLNKSQTFYNIYHKKEEKFLNRYYNLIHMQLRNAVLRATVGIKKFLLVRGVGYKFIKKNQYLTLQVGYSHKVNILMPSFIKTKLNRKATKIKFVSNNICVLTGILASIRGFKKPDVYKGKGVRYRQDTVIRKEGKKKKSF